MSTTLFMVCFIWKCVQMAKSQDHENVTILSSGEAIPCWTATGKEYLLLQKFPHLQKRFQSGVDCLEQEERSSLHTLIAQREEELKTRVDYLTPLHSKVSLLAGGNLVQVDTDAVVNASNHWLTSGKGVNGALHSAAGECLLEQCLTLGGCEVGQAKVTSGYNLPASYVFHTVGPEGRDKQRAVLLRSCYQSCLSLLLSHNLRSIAFPCISTGAYRYPSVEAADIALSTVREWLLEYHEQVDRIVFVTRTARDEEAYSMIMLTYFPLL